MLGPGDTGEADQTGFHYTTVELQDLQMYQLSHIIHNTCHMSLSKAQETSILQS